MGVVRSGDLILPDAVLYTEEFVGPFPSWKNVKTDYGAVGNGVHDDTAAIQAGLNAISSTRPILYFPAGTYKITSTLTIAAQTSIGVIGEDPATVSFVWAGAGGGTMLYINGVSYSRFDRITFNGASIAGVAVDQSKSDGTSNYFDTGNQYADDVFENVPIGIRGGNLDFGFAETSILRCSFANCSSFGIILKNFNALDCWVWWSQFINCGTGVSNTPGAGAFQVFGCIFTASAVADITYGNTGIFTFRNNYSSGSKRFVSAGGTNAPDLVLMQGNTIIDTTDALSVWQNDPGPVVFIDNTVRTLHTAVSVPIGSGANATAATGPVVLIGNNNFPVGGGNLFSMGNTFTTGSAICSLTSPELGSTRCHSIQDQIVSAGSVNPNPPVLPPTPPNNHRTIFEVVAGSSSATIQTAINNAVAAGNRAVVHIQPGSYSIIATLTIPANTDIQIIGDGGNSVLNWSGGGSGPILRLIGPSQVTLSNFVAQCNFTSNGIECTNADQIGANIFLEQSLAGGSQTHLFVDGLTNAAVEIRDFQHYTSTGTAHVITGSGKTNFFCGVTAGNHLAYDTSGLAHTLINAVWNDAGPGAPLEIAHASGGGAFTYAGSMLALQDVSVPSVRLTGFGGDAALLNLMTFGKVVVAGDGSGANVLALGLSGMTADYLVDTTSPADTLEFLLGQYDLAGNATPLAEIGSADPVFLIATLDQFRTTQPRVPSQLPPGVTNIALYRINVSNALTGIHLQVAP